MQIAQHLSSTAGNVAQNSVGRVSTGLISEVVYREDQPLLTQLLLLPLLQQLGQQSRWQLWLTPQQKLSREWVQSAGLPLTKVMQINQLSPCDTVESMIRALRTGNYSVVIGWLPEELTEEEHFRLTEAAEEGNAIGFIMRPVRSRFLPQRTTFWAKNSLKFVSLSKIKIFLEFF
jgi:cell division inhibitor SulA